MTAPVRLVVITALKAVVYEGKRPVAEYEVTRPFTPEELEEIRLANYEEVA